MRALIRLFSPRGHASSSSSPSRGQTFSAQVSAIPQSVLDVLAENNISVSQIPGAGRGLVATRAMDMGASVLIERPYACHPLLPNLEKVCYQCLAVLGKGSGLLAAGHRHPFCSLSCLEAAERTHLKVEVDKNFQALRDHCQAVNLGFPLLVQRIATSTLGAGLPWKQSVQDLNYLTYSSIPDPTPEPWLEAHHLLCQGLQECRSSGLGSSAADRRDPTLAYFLGVLSRLQINVFRVDCIFPLEGSLQSRAAAVIGGQTEEGASGSALYRAAALFNHDCAPNVGVGFPNNDGQLTLTADQNIREGDQLCISYIDTTLPVKQRQQKLFLGYGFKCTCSRCREEA